jgi:hypothetical protein
LLTALAYSGGSDPRGVLRDLGLGGHRKSIETIL